MASAFSHAIVATAIGSVVQPRRAPWWTWAIGLFLSAAPDLDVIGFHSGVRYGDLLGHRGLTHSLLFAACVAGLLAPALASRARISPRRMFLFYFLALSSHGLLDAMTNGGLGVAFFSPITNTRFFFPYRPIEVSPIGVERFFSERGWAVIRSEALWLALPSAVVIAFASLVRQNKVTHPN